MPYPFKETKFVDGTYDFVIRIQPTFGLLIYRDGQGNDIEKPKFIPSDIDENTAVGNINKLSDIIIKNGYVNSDADCGWYDELYVEGFHLKGES